jgi:chemotaxis protein MotB
MPRQGARNKVQSGQHATPSHERWLVSYADFITLLFAFFVVMFATAQTDNAKTRAVSESVKKALQGESFKEALSRLMGEKGALNGLGDAPKPGSATKLDDGKLPASKPGAADASAITLADLVPLLTKELQQEIESGRLALRMTSRGLTISFTQAALFPSGEDEISPDSYPTVEKIVNAINKVPNPIRAEGHTDSIPIHNSRFRSNWELSAARSIALAELFTKFGVARERLSIAGYADTAPIDNNDTEEGRRKNRRVDIVLLNSNGLKGEPDHLASANSVNQTPPR